MVAVAMCKKGKNGFDKDRGIDPPLFFQGDNAGSGRFFRNDRNSWHGFDKMLPQAVGVGALMRDQQEIPGPYVLPVVGITPDIMGGTE